MAEPTNHVVIKGVNILGGYEGKSIFGIRQEESFKLCQTLTRHTLL